MIYLLGLTFLLFLNYKQIKDVLIFADDELKHAGPDTKVMYELLLQLLELCSINKISLV